VLVIIGLIIGGILVGQSLISASQVRATVTQIEKYNQAANTFYGKYGYLPGDIPASLVTQFGFTAAPTRTGTAGCGDGNGVLQGSDGSACGSANAICWGFSTELAWFWEDLSTNSGLIEGGVDAATNASISITNNGGFAPYVPAAKIGGGNYVFVFSVNGINYFQVVDPTSVASNSATNATVGLTVAQAYAIDGKMDDGLPASGNVMAAVSVSGFTSPNGGGSPPLVWATGGFNSPSYMSSASPSTTTCYDTTSGQYSMTQNGGAGVNCALSFRMQAGD
jgi:hypothetical protein